MFHLYSPPLPLPIIFTDFTMMLMLQSLLRLTTVCTRKQVVMRKVYSVQKGYLLIIGCVTVWIIRTNQITCRKDIDRCSTILHRFDLIQSYNYSFRLGFILLLFHSGFIEVLVCKEHQCSCILIFHSVLLFED